MLELIGHLHPVIVHLPIGILLFGVGMMVIQHFKNTDYSQSINLAFLVGSMAAVFAGIAGWLLSNSGEYDASLVLKHQWTGIATMVIGILAYLFKKYQKILGGILTILIIITGHFGGTLTHGENYLLNSNKSSNKRPSDTLITELKIINNTISNGVDSIQIVKYNLYKDRVAPLLKMKCYGCHSAIKQKNGLRLDGEVFIKKGGKNGMILMRGDMLNSPLYTNLLLPIEDEKHMPPKGKHQLNQSEILIIAQWLKTGASFEDKIDTLFGLKLLNTKENEDSVTTKIKKLPLDLGIVKSNKKSLIVLSSTPLELITPIGDSDIQLFNDQNISLTNISTGSNFVIANYINAVPFNHTSLWILQKIKQQLAVLKLTNLPINDDDIKSLIGLTHLKKIYLENTTITNQSMGYLIQLPELEQINLYGTAITDEGLHALSSLKKLTHLYLWKTKVSIAGVEAFKKLQPTIKIEMGEFKFQKQ